jgi:uncharacterized phage-associated protein
MTKKILYTDIADYFIALSNETGSLITNLKLQKLVYYTQAWHLAMFETPIFAEEFEAWIHGPVLPDLFYQYKGTYYRPIERNDLNAESMAFLRKKFGKTLSNLIENVVEEYFGMESYALEQTTHAEEPWLKARKNLPQDAPSHEIISKESMKKYYQKFITVDV